MKRPIVIAAVLSMVPLWFIFSAKGAPATQPVERTYQDLIDAQDFSQAHRLADALGAVGDEAIPWLVNGTQHARTTVRDVCYRVLQERFPSHAKSIGASIQGLDDPENGWINVRCALFLAQQKAAVSIPRLSVLSRTKSGEAIIRFACAQAMAELGEADSFPTLYEGLGSDDPYVRQFANRGIKALCGKDLTAFGYETPHEDALLSGSAILRTADPIKRAEWKATRWKAISAFSQWLKSDRNDLYSKLLP